MSDDEQSGEDKPPFRPFTRDSLMQIETRKAEEYAKKKELEKKRADGELRYEDDEMDDSGPRPNPNLEQGMPLPIRLAAQFDPDLASTPLEDIDPYYANQATFVIISKKKDIFRFSATNSVYLLHPWNPVRRVAIGILTHPLFTLCIILTILANCGIMILPASAASESTEVLFTAIYTCEMVIKIMARGFILESFTYLRDAWNWLDFCVVMMSYVTMGITLGNLAALRTFRVLRALKTVAIVPGLKTIVGAVIESVKNLRDVIILTIFSLSVFALIGLQIYMGVLTQICIKRFPIEEIEWTPETWSYWNKNATYWWKPENHEDDVNYPICGNSSGAGTCPENYTCVGGFARNPDNGYTSFDSFGWALLSAFRLMTQDSWETLYQIVLRATGPGHLLFFILVIFLGSFYLVNLILAIVAMSYDELQKKSEEDEIAAMADLAAMKEEAEAAARMQAGAKSTGRRSYNFDETSINSDYEEEEVLPGQSNIPKSRKTSLSLPESPVYLDLSKRNSHVRKSSLIKTSLIDPDEMEESQSHHLGRSLPVVASTEAMSKNSPRSLRSIMDEESHESGSEMHEVGKYLGKQASRRGSFREVRYRSNNDTVVDMSDVVVLKEMIDRADQESKMSDLQEEEDFRHRLRQMFIDGCLRCIDVFCIWDCGFPFSVFQKVLNLIVFDPFSELFITLAIAMNTLFMALDHYELKDNPQLSQILKTGNIVFSTIFGVEAAMKLIAMSPKYYFQVGWNVFDFIIVFLSLIEILVEDAGLPGISAFRSFRLLRVFKLAKSWPTLNLLISIMGKTMGALGNLVFVLLIILFIFAVMGMQLFSKNYFDKTHLFPGGELPRWNFTDFGHSFMIIFRVLCGEWIESMWDCMLVGDVSCVPFFLATVIIGNLVVLNLFLALLLSSFGASNLSSPQADAETNKLAEAFLRFKRLFRWIRLQFKNVFMFLLRNLKCSKKKNQVTDEAVDTASISSNRTNTSSKEKLSRNGKIITQDATATIPRKKGRLNQKARMIMNAQKLTNSRKLQNSTPSIDGRMDSVSRNSTFERTGSFGNNRFNSQKSFERSKSQDEFVLRKRISKEEMISAVSEDGQTDGDSANDEDEEKMIGNDQKRKKEPQEEEECPVDCLPPAFYEKFPIFKVEGTAFGVGWATLRLKTFRLIENKYFETAVIIMILLSSMALALEDVHLSKNPVLIDILYYMDRIFTVIFLLEMFVKWLALGFRTYFTNAWCWLDFVIVMVSIINFIAALAGQGSVQAFKTMRTLRALRPLRAMSRMQGMRVVVNALVQAIPSIFNVLLVCLIFWLIFAIMGVQLFSGKFHKCIDPIDRSVPDFRIIGGKLECLANNMTWENSKMNFDHVGKAYLSLFQVATFKGWIDIMNNAVDARQEDEQPHREVGFAMYAYFVIFVIFGSFFTLNLFIGVIIDNFNEQKKKAGGSLEMFMTEDQKKYYNAMKKMGSKKPLKAIPRPKWKPQAIVFEIVTHQKFQILIMLFIGINMVTMTMDHYQMNDSYKSTLAYLNAFFIAIFSAECALKIFALRQHYFTEPWNLFDFVVVIMSILGLLLDDLIQQYFVSPTLLRVVRVAKVGRVLRLVKGAKGIRTLLFALAMSLPALFNICLLLFLVMFIFAIFGMSFFMNVKTIPNKPGGLDEVFNFRTLWQSMILLFQISTSAGWDGVLSEITREEDCHPPDPELGLSGDCGSGTVGVAFLLSYLVISFLIIINMYIAVILENYSQATEEVQEGLTDDDYDMYYEFWAQFDPDGAQYIRYDQLSDFLDILEPPLQIHKPNKFKIISMDIPICKGDMMYCVDILDALTRDFFARKGNAIETETVELSESTLHNQERPGYEPISSTLWRQREEHCARIIQLLWRRYHKIKQPSQVDFEINDGQRNEQSVFETTTALVNEHKNEEE